MNNTTEESLTTILPHVHGWIHPGGSHVCRQALDVSTNPRAQGNADGFIDCAGSSLAGCVWGLEIIMRQSLCDRNNRGAAAVFFRYGVSMAAAMECPYFDFTKNFWYNFCRNPREWKLKNNIQRGNHGNLCRECVCNAAPERACTKVWTSRHLLHQGRWLDTVHRQERKYVAASGRALCGHPYKIAQKLVCTNE